MRILILNILLIDYITFTKEQSSREATIMNTNTFYVVYLLISYLLYSLNY